MIPNDRLAAMITALDDDGRHFVEVVLQFEYDRVQLARRPALRVITGGPAPCIAADGKSHIACMGGAR